VDCSVALVTAHLPFGGRSNQTGVDPVTQDTRTPFCFEVISSVRQIRHAANFPCRAWSATSARGGDPASPGRFIEWFLCTDASCRRPRQHWGRGRSAPRMHLRRFTQLAQCPAQGVPRTYRPLLTRPLTAATKAMDRGRVRKKVTSVTCPENQR